MINDYLDNPTAAISVNARSVSCRCRLILKNLHFIHAAAKRFVMAVNMPISRAMEVIGAHSVESRWQKMLKKMPRGK
jgi:hypothetical protein